MGHVFHKLIWDLVGSKRLTELMMKSTTKYSMGLSIQHHSAILCAAWGIPNYSSIGSCGLPSTIPYKPAGFTAHIATAGQHEEIGYSNTNIPMNMVRYSTIPLLVRVPGDSPRTIKIDEL